MAAEPQAGARPAIPHVIALAVAALGAAITLAVAVGVKTSVEQRIVGRFGEVAMARAERLGYEFQRYHDDLATVAASLDAAPTIDKASFERLARHGVSVPHIRALMWFDPGVLEETGPGAPSPAARHRQPATSPAVPRYIAQFLDTPAAALPEQFVPAAQRGIFMRAYRTGKPQLSAPLHTDHFPYEPPLYQVAIAVPPNHGLSEGGPVRGFLVAVYRAQPIVEGAMRVSDAIAVRVTDRGMPLGRNLLAVHERPADTPLLGRTIQNTSLRMGGRDWDLEFAPTEAFIAENRTDEALLVLLLGFALTAATSIGALVSVRWRDQMLTRVARRTAELAASEARQRAVVADMADALVVTDSQGKIESVNAAAERLFGWEASELIGHTLALLVPQAASNDDETGPDADSESRWESAAAQGALHGLRRDGSAFPLGLALSEVREQDGIRRIALMRDLSRERRAERAMSTFIAGTSKATGLELLHAATSSLAQALGMRHALIAEHGEKPGTLRTLSHWSGSGHEGERCYDIAGEPCAEVLLQQMRCYADGVHERFAHARLCRELQTQSYVGHVLRGAGGRVLGVVALHDTGVIEQPELASSLLSMAASRIAAEIERLESHKALLSSRERLALAVEGSQLALWDVNVTTGEVFLSERWSAMLGEPAAATQSTLAQLLDRIHPEDRPTVDRAYRDVLSGEVSFYGVTHRVQRADGGVVWVRSHGKVSQRDANGRALRLVGTNADVTWEKTAAEEVARRERELRAISDNVPAIIVRLDKDFRYLYANRRYAVTVGAEVNALPGKRLIDVLGEGSYREVEPYLLRTLEGETVTYDRELELGGQRRWLEMTVIPDVNAEGEVQGAFCIGLDMTERKEIERRMLEARINAEAATRAKSEFLATMSHEIRTPMNGVLGLAGLLLDTELSAEQQGYVETLHRSATSLLEILNDVLDMSKIEAGKLALEPIPFELAATVEDVAALWAPRAAAKGLELAVQVDPSCPALVVGDPGRVRQVLGNLLGNAIKFTERGYVLLRVSAAAESAEVTPVLFEVEDTGVGIEPEHCRNLFEPFSQADTSTTRRFGGTGLGLAICRRLVQLMDGEIGVDSAPGAGARFWFTASLPACAEQPAPEAGELQDRRILVVDDHRVSRTVLRKQLQAFGARVTCVPDAAAAWQRLHGAPLDDPYHAAVIDHAMPDMDGIELGRRVRADPRWHALPMVLLTAGKQKTDSAQARDAGFAGVLVKPARAELLRRMLEAALAGRPTAELLPRQRLEPSAERFRGRVLLVEDNEVNRRVALAVLRKLGLEAHAAVDGEQAVAFTAETRYDLVLMDMHMPNMDGLEATRAIRAREAGTAERLPIVAMTANVLGEARAACFEAGMDDFLPKPFAREHLLQALRRWVPVDSAAVAPVRSPAAEPVALALRRESLSAVMDHARLDALREALGAELAELVTVFLDSAAGTIAALVQAAEQGEPDAVYRHAHTLKSSAANIGAMALSALARRIENEHKTDPAAADACIAELAGELARVQPLLLQAAAAAQEGLRAVG